MRVRKAVAMGMCFGVRDALAIADAEPAPREVTVHGELVHNESVLGRLRSRGFVLQSEHERRIPDTARVLITAHGVSNRQHQLLANAGKVVVDTTCPLVRNAHKAAMTLARECDHVVVLGKPGHVEVRGITGDLDSYDVVSDVAGVRCYFVRTLGVVCQTTFSTQRIAPVLRALRTINPGTDVRFVDTVCEPTRQRLQAVRELASSVDVVVVVGGLNSNNTKQLVKLCEGYGARVHHVQAASDLHTEWFDGCDEVGLTAGTSTPQEVIDEVCFALL